MGFILGWTFEHRRFDLQLLTTKLRHFICCCPCYQSRIIILQVSLKSVYGSFFFGSKLLSFFIKSKNMRIGTRQTKNNDKNIVNTI